MRPRHGWFVLVLVGLLALGALTSPEAGAQGALAGDPAGEVGKLTFPTSCADQARKTFAWPVASSTSTSTHCAPNA